MSGFWNTKELLKKILGRRSRTDYIVILLIGVMVLIVAVPAGNGGKKTRQTPEKTVNESTVSESENGAYVRQLKEELTAMLCGMDGVGKCSVMITLEDDGRFFLDRDVVSGSDRREEHTVIYDNGGGESPYVLRRERPKVAGVMVVAQGGADPVVVSNISKAVMSLFGLEAHKITVVKMSVQEDSL